MLAHVMSCAISPFLKDNVASSFDLLDVMIHVFNEKNVIIERLLVFGVTATACLTSSRGLFSNEFERLPHGTIDLRVRVIDRVTNFQGLRIGLRGGQHVFNCDGKVRERLDECNHTLSLLDFHLRLLDAVNL